jgi:hypothetical protein
MSARSTIAKATARSVSLLHVSEFAAGPEAAVAVAQEGPAHGALAAVLAVVGAVTAVAAGRVDAVVAERSASIPAVVAGARAAVAVRASVGLLLVARIVAFAGGAQRVVVALAYRVAHGRDQSIDQFLARRARLADALEQTLPRAHRQNLTHRLLQVGPHLAAGPPEALVTAEAVREKRKHGVVLVVSGEGGSGKKVNQTR